MRNRPIMLFAAVVAAGALAQAGTGKDSLSDRLALRVSTHSGPLPLSLNIKGDLSGIHPDEIDTCIVQVNRIYVSPGGLRYDERKEHPCTEPAEQIVSSPAFEKNLELKDLGDYELRILLRTLDGRQVAGMSQHVKVYNGLEVGARGTYRKD